MSNWKKEYDELILKGDLDGAIALCKSSVRTDKKIYKFFKGTNRDLNTVKENKIWMSRGDYFNDPFDSSFFVNRKSKERYPEEERDMAIRDFLEQEDQDNLSHDMQHNSLITSFSENSDSILMWSYYARDHKGFCVEYSLSKLVEKQLILPVVYSDNMLQITKYTENNRIIGMLVKAKCWQHEKEWRMIKLADENSLENGELVENIPLPTAFFYGIRIWNNERENIESKHEYNVLCKEIKDKKCKISINPPYEDMTVDIQYIMQYTKEKKIPLYGYELSRNEFSLKKIRLIP